MRVISFKDTVLLKRGVFLTAAAMSSCIAAPSFVNGGLWRDPLPVVSTLGALSAIFVVFLWRTQIHRLADEVHDAGDHLLVRMGRVHVQIAFSEIADVSVASGSGINRIAVRLLSRRWFGWVIQFLPQASLWSDLPRLEYLARGLCDRAAQARSVVAPR